MLSIIMTSRHDKDSKELNQPPARNSASFGKRQEVENFDQTLHGMHEITEELGRQFVVGPQFLTAEKMLRHLRSEAEGLEKSVTVSDLRAMLKDRNLTASGNKDELLNRLYHHADYFDDDHRNT